MDFFSVMHIGDRVMDELVKWYWEHGVRRGYDVNDPDRELRKISIEGWLDPVVEIIDRNRAIQANADRKACLALWGPSQTGKSTMMSRYVDGQEDDGSDSALTWSDTHKTRFSPPPGGMSLLQVIAPDTLIFNPYNHNSDASGLATRYTLQKVSEKTVNPDFPIEIKFTTRTQIIQSLSLGYLSECKPVDEHIVYTINTFLAEIEKNEASETTSCVTEKNAEAYDLLKDIANAIECMKGNERFSNVFKKGDWNNKIRKKLVSAPNLLSNIREAEKFMAKIFWDSSDVLTQFYRKTNQMLQDLCSEWGKCKILASMEVGALLLDIDSFKSYVSPKGEEGKQVKEKVLQLAYEKKDNEVYVFLKPGGSKIAGESFGCFQAICAELKVPLQQEKLELDSSKNTFVELAKKCDFLDFPGVSNKNMGKNVGDDSAALIDLGKVSQEEIFTSVFKQGKTQCFVYNYAKKYGIDAFSILVRTDRNPSQSSLLSSGICDWQLSYDSTWKPGQTAVLPVFVNMTFFASLLNNVALNGLGSGLNPYIERIQELTFARRESAFFFATTYQQFHDGRIDKPDQKDSTIASIMSDPVFATSTGLTEENIQAVYNPDGGLDYMFGKMVQRIDSSRRFSRCQSILDEDKRQLCRLISSQLPAENNSSSDERKQKLLECKISIEDALKKIEDEDDITKYQEFSVYVKDLFSASSGIFDAVPLNANSMSKKEISTYVKLQVGKWYNHKNNCVRHCDWLTTEQQNTILSALRDAIDVDALFHFIRNHLGQISNQVMARAARYPFAIAFNNLLQWGTVQLNSNALIGDRSPAILNDLIMAKIDKDSSRDNSPYCHMVLFPLLSRLEKLSEDSIAGERPPQDGDAELKTIFDQIQVSKFFQIL